MLLAMFIPCEEVVLEQAGGYVAIVLQRKRKNIIIITANIFILIFKLFKTCM